MIRKFVAAGAAVAALAGTAALASPALAAGGPGDKVGQVQATVTIQQSLTVKGIDPAVAFPAVAPSQKVTVPAAETFTVDAFVPNGATISLQNDNDGFTYMQGGPTVIRDEQVSITTQSNGEVPLQPLAGQFTALETVPTGSTDVSEDWSLTVPPTVSYTGSLSGSWTYYVAAN